MQIAQAVLLMLLAVTLSDVGGRQLLPRIPVPFLQILLGMAMAWSGQVVKVSLDPDFFFLVFLAPLLFADAVRMPRRELLQLKAPILGAAVGLVVATVVSVGVVVHWLVPSISLPMACALGAVLAPTDAVAVSALAGKLPMPAIVMHLLRGEALLNDASGVVGLRVAVALALTGSCQPLEVVASFIKVSLGGLLLGALVGWLGARMSIWLSKQEQRDPAGQALLSLLLPFSSFLLAERLHVSGILASVASGLIFNLVGMVASHNVQRRIRFRSLWHTLEFVLNGFIFLLLGLELPSQLGSQDFGAKWIFYSLAVVVMLAAIRLVWARFCLPLSGYRNLLLFTFSGIRGTVSLAAALSIPSVGLPERDKIIFLTMSVVCLSLLIAAAGLPWLLKGDLLTDDDPTVAEEREARLASYAGALEAIDEASWALENRGWERRVVQPAADHLRSIFSSLTQELANPESGQQAAEAFRCLRLAALLRQREVIFSRLQQGKINGLTRAALEHELDLDQASLQAFLGANEHG